MNKRAYKNNIKRTPRRAVRAKREAARRRLRRIAAMRIAMLFTVLTVLTAAGFNILNTAFARGEETVCQMYTVTVSKGDTLWSIAQRYSADGTDVRKTVGNIIRENNMTDTHIKAGDTVKIPIYE